MKAEKKYVSPGFTLAEIMIAMAIALIIMGGVYRTMVDEGVNHDRSEKILDMQNNARVALERLVRDVRRTGFLGCGGTQAANTLVNAGTDATKIGKLTIAKTPSGIERNMLKNTILKQIVGYPAMTGYEANVNYLGEAMGFADNAPSSHAYYQPGTDALTLVYLSSERVVDAAAPMGSGTVPVPLTAGGFEQYDILYVTDCENFSLFQKTNGDNTLTVEHKTTAPTLNNIADLGKNYGQSAQARVFKLTTSTYFVEKDSFDLSYNDNNADRTVAVNIEDLQFEFLFDDDGNNNLTNDAWVSNFGAHTSEEVRAVRIWVLAMSDVDATFTDTSNYDYPNSPYCSATSSFTCRGTGTPASKAPIGSPSNGEHRHRYLASAVVYLRNAGLR